MKKTLTFFALLLVAMVYGQVPNISYASPQSYPVGSAITPLTPTNTGGAVVGSANVSTLAGKTQGQDGTGTEATFNAPIGIAIDAVGNGYVADSFNHKIRKISPNGVVTTLAGNGTDGATDGTGTAASFSGPAGVAVDAMGNIYVADYYNHKIRKISPSGVVTTLAGSGSAGATDGTGTSASFFNPRGVAVDGTGNVYVADLGNYKIRKISPSGVVTTLAGSGTYGATDGGGTVASFKQPSGIAVDALGNVYIADGVSVIRKITTEGVVSTLAGNKESYGSTDGHGTAASFYNPIGLSIDSSGNIYVADSNNHKIRKITLSGLVTTLAGSGTAGANDGPGTAASFNIPSGVAIDATGNIYVADSQNNKIRKINTAGVVISWVGIGVTNPTDGIGKNAGFHFPNGIAVDAMGNTYVADTNNQKIRKITPEGLVSTLAGSGTAGSDDGTGIAASFNQPSGVALDVAGNTYVADFYNSKIRKITPEGVVSTLAEIDARGFGVAVDATGNVYVTCLDNKIRKISPIGVVNTLAGSGIASATDGSGTAASFNRPLGVAVDAIGNVYVADNFNNKIRKISPEGLVTTLAGSGTYGDTDGDGLAASFKQPRGVVVDALSNLYVVDTFNNKIKKITPEGLVTTLAGSGSYGAIDGSGTTASFSYPVGIAVDAKGSLYVADTNNHKIRKITVMGGYQITPTLPAGLSFDETTGVISGTPTVASPLTTYTVTASNESGSTTTTIAISTALLGNPSFTKESLSLFPNPAHNLLQIQTSDNLTIDRVIITDLTGKVILEQALETNTINIAQLASGMYLIKAFSGQQAFTSKFMKAL